MCFIFLLEAGEFGSAGDLQFLCCYVHALFKSCIITARCIHAMCFSCLCHVVIFYDVIYYTTCMHIHVCIYIYIYTHVYISLSLHIYIYIYTHIACMYVYICLSYYRWKPAASAPPGTSAASSRSRRPSY